MTGYFGNGNFGYGVYGVSNPVNTDVNTAAPEEFGAVSKFVPYPQFRSATGFAEFAGSVTVHPISYYRGLSGLTEFQSYARAVPQPQLRASGAPEFDSQVLYWSGAIMSELEGAPEFTGYARTVPQVQFRPVLLAPLELVGRVQPVVAFKLIPQLPSRFEYGARTGRWATFVIARPQRVRIELQGRASATVWPILRPRAQVELQARNGFKAWFVFPVGPVNIEIVGYSHIAYGWSDMTSPGRDPVPAWQEAPAADPGGAWFEVTAAADAWQDVPAPPQS